MDLNQALFTLAQNNDGGSEAVQAVETVQKAFKDLTHELETIQKEHTAMKRVIYLLVESHPDHRLRNEMHSTYTKISSGLAAPGE